MVNVAQLQLQEKTMHKITQALSTRIESFTSYRTWLHGVAASILLVTTAAQAGDAAITNVELTPAGDGIFQVSVTLRHDDTGWDHYANRWDVLDEKGNLLGSRELLHPHVNEQPFTRSLRVEIPESVKVVTIVAADSVHGDNNETVTAEVPRQ